MTCAECARVRLELLELIQEESEQASANEAGFSYRHGNNLFNGGAAVAARRIVGALREILDTDGNSAARKDGDT